MAEAIAIVCDRSVEKFQDDRTRRYGVMADCSSANRKRGRGWSDVSSFLLVVRVHNPSFETIGCSVMELWPIVAQPIGKGGGA